MITFVTVWVLTITDTNYTNSVPVSNQFSYATQEICLRQGGRLKEKYTKYYCNFQQVPIYAPKER